MTAIKAIVAARDGEVRDWLGRLLGPESTLDSVGADDPDAIFTMIGASDSTDAVFVQVEPEARATGVRLISRLVDRHPDVPIIAMGRHSDSETVLSCMRAGAADFVVPDRDDQELPAIINRVLRRGAAAGAPAAQGKLFAVVSGHPYDAVSFFAEHLALACHEAQSTGTRTVLVDSAMPSGAGAIYLNINQTYTLLDAVNDLHRCDQTLIETAFNQHNSGVYVLSMPEDVVGVPRANHDDLLRLVEVFRSLFGVAVITLDATQPIEFLAQVIGQADRTLVLSDQSILKSRHNKYLLHALRREECALDRTALVVDNYRRRLGLEPENLAELLEIPLLATLSGQGVHRIQAMNAGEPLFEVAPKDRYCSALRELATALVSGRTPPAIEPGLLSRLFGA